MGAELTETTVGAEGATPDEGAGAQGAQLDQSVDRQSQGDQIGPELQKAVAEAVAKVRDEYEAKGTGHISKLKSKYDSRIAELEGQLRQRHQAQYQEAQQLLEAGDYQQAAQLLYTQNTELMGQQAQANAQAEIGDWVGQIMGGLGYDLEADEEAAGMAVQWVERLMQNPGLAWDFQQEVAQTKVEAEQQRVSKAEKELKQLRDSLPGLVRQEMAKAFTEAGFTPQATDEGGVPKKPGDWRQKPATTLVREGLEERLANPPKRT